MCPHCPHDLWCQRCCLGTFFRYPYLVGTSMSGSGARCTIHSPCSSSAKTSSRKSWGSRSGSRSKCSFFFINACTGMGMALSFFPGSPLQLDPCVLQALFHDVLEDHVETLV